MSEVWKSIEGYEGLYEVSSSGRVARKCCDRRFTDKIMSFGTNRAGYKHVTLSTNGNRKTYDIQRLVACAFVKNSYGKPDVNHIDGDKSNNMHENLEWVTKSENMYHSIKIGLHQRGCEHVNSKLTEDDVRQIRYLEGYYTQITVAIIYGVSRRLVQLIQSGRVWKHIT